MHTVQAALRRGITVGAVPGSVRSPASEGTNMLIAEGAFVVRDVSDVLVAVELAIAGDPTVSMGRRSSFEACGGSSITGGVVLGDPPVGPTGLVLEALSPDPSSLEAIVGRVDLPVEEVALELEHLADAGWARVEHGQWSRR
jgi:predicted Rossmann fold nucleotide-binding protein DprA/Smf involved in DNA uptake